MRSCKNFQSFFACSDGRSLDISLAKVVSLDNHSPVALRHLALFSAPFYLSCEAACSLKWWRISQIIHITGGPKRRTLMR